MAPIELGNWAAIEVKINSDMPLPIPRSVMSSPNHMMRPVPAVMVMTMSTITYQESLTMRSALQDVPNSAPVRATVIRVVAWSRPNAKER